MMKTLLILFFVFGLAQAFTTPQPQRSSVPTATGSLSKSARFMAPKFDGEKWVATKAEEGPEAGYDATRTLLMHGPKPWFQRVFQSEDYEQAVLKFMAGDKCSRDEAQGNMDAYLRNPQDWAFARMEMGRTGKKIDYSKVDKKSLVLTFVWSGIVAVVGGRVAYAISTGTDFWAFGPFTGSY
jgi:hypothetical protein